MKSYAVVLVLELDEAEGNPANWDWLSVIDTAGSAGVMGCVEIDPDPSSGQVDRFHTMTETYADSLRHELGVQ